MRPQKIHRRLLWHMIGRWSAHDQHIITRSNDDWHIGISYTRYQVPLSTDYEDYEDRCIIQRTEYNDSYMINMKTKRPYIPVMYYYTISRTSTKNRHEVRVYPLHLESKTGTRWNQVKNTHTTSYAIGQIEMVPGWEGWWLGYTCINAYVLIFKMFPSAINRLWPWFF